MCLLGEAEPIAYVNWTWGFGHTYSVGKDNGAVLTDRSMGVYRPIGPGDVVGVELRSCW